MISRIVFLFLFKWSGDYSELASKKYLCRLLVYDFYR